MTLRLGFLTHLHVGADAADSYRIALDLFSAAEEMGYDSGWVAQAYLGEASPKARIGLSRAVYPAEDRRTAIDHMQGGVAEYVDSMIKRGFFPAGLTQEEYFARSHIHYGHPEQVVESLRSDRVLPLTTELICQVQPGHPTPKQIVTALERIATAVAPALGWRTSWHCRPP